MINYFLHEGEIIDRELNYAFDLPRLFILCLNLSYLKAKYR